MNLERSISLLKRTTWYEVVYISIIILPFPLFAWKEILEWLSLSSENRTNAIAALILFQLIGISLFVYGSASYRRKLNILTMTLGYLQDKDFKMVSFDKIREHYG